MSEAVAKNKNINKDTIGSKQKTIGILEKIIFISLMVVIFYAPFLRGLFFEMELLPTEIIVFVTFILFWVYKHLKRDRVFIKTPIEYAALGFVLVYFISIFVAVSLRLAIAEWLKYCMYFAVFFMITDMVKTMKQKMTVMWVIVASATGVALLGLDGAAGGQVAGAINKVFEALHVNYKIFGTFEGGRIYSTLQYPNALAAYLIAIFFICIGIILVSQKLWHKAIAGGISFTLLITFILTLSRGAYLLAPAMLMLFVILLPKGKRIGGAAYGVALPVIAAIFSTPLLRYISAPKGNEMKIWFAVIGGIVVSTLVVIALKYAVKWFEAISWKVYVSLAVAAVVLASGVLIFLLNAKAPLELMHTMDEENSVKTVMKSIVLEPNTQYKLVYEVDANTANEKNYAYRIDINSRTEKDILLDKSTNIAVFIGNKSNGTEKREIDFKVPAESRIVDIIFSNYYQDTSIKVMSAQIIEASTGSIIKNLALKYKYIPESITNRFENIQASQSSIQRATYYKDGLNIFKDYWLIGAGGGAWSQLYFSYQSFLYWTTLPHNYLLQIGVESGIIGILALIYLVAAISAFMFKSRFGKKDIEDIQDKGVLQGVLFGAIAALILHSFIDFDLSLSAIFLLLWLLIALLNSNFRHIERIELENNKLKTPPLVMAVLMVAVLWLPISFVTAKTSYDEAAKALKEKDNKQALSNIGNAVRMDPFEASYKVDYAGLLLSQKNPVAQADFSEASKNIAKAEKLAQHDTKVLPRIGAFYLQTGNIQKGLEYFDEIVKQRPYNPSDWELKANAYMQVAGLYFQKNDYNNAMNYVDRILNIIDEAKQTNEKNIGEFVFTQGAMEIFERLKYIKDNLYSQKKINAEDIVFYSYPSIDMNSDGLPDQWNVSNKKDVKIISGETLRIERISSEENPYIQSRSLNLLPNESYRIEIELDNSIGVKSIPYFIVGVNKNIDQLTQSGNKYVGEITVPENYKITEDIIGRDGLLLFIKQDMNIKSLLIICK